MKHINPENVDYFYFAPGDDVAGLTSGLGLEPVWALNPVWGTDLTFPWWDALPEVRLVGEPWGWRNALGLYLLYWGNGKNLSELDARVTAGKWSDADFEGSVETGFSITLCASCNRAWETLIILSDTYLSAPDLRRNKFEAWRHRLLRCKACNSHFRQLVVKIYGEYVAEAKAPRREAL